MKQFLKEWKLDTIFSSASSSQKSAIKIISDKKGKIDYNEKVHKIEKKVSKEEKPKKN